MTAIFNIRSRQITFYIINQIMDDFVQFLKIENVSCNFIFLTYLLYFSKIGENTRYIFSNRRQI